MSITAYTYAHAPQPHVCSTSKLSKRPVHPQRQRRPTVCTTRISALDTLPFSPPGSPLSIPQFSHLPPITHPPSHPLHIHKGPNLSATRKQIAGTQVTGKRLVVSLRIKTLACLIDRFSKEQTFVGKEEGGVTDQLGCIVRVFGATERKIRRRVSVCMDV